MSKDLKKKHLYIVLTFCFAILLYAFNVHAGGLTLSWVAPTTNADGTPVTDLSGYIVYYGTSSGNYFDNIDVGNVTTYQVTNLVDGLTYYFAVTTYDTSGNESGYSTEEFATINPSSVSAPEITITDAVSPSTDLQIPFGNITEGSSAKQIVTITNNGNANLVIGNIAKNNPLAEPFSILNDFCSGQTLSQSSNCTLTVRFSPTITGTFNDSFDIPSNDSDESLLTINISGIGNALPVPDITVTDSVAPADNIQIPFGLITAGNASDQTVTITNDGNADLVIGMIAQSNPLAAPFSIVDNNCSGQTLSSSSSCTVTVRFSPSTTGTFSDSFNIPSNDSDENPITVSVNGTGNALPVPDITVTDSVAPIDNQHVPFGSVTEGSGVNQTITITNDGNADLVIGSIAQNNPLIAPFTITNNNCSGQTISPSSNCTLTVRFGPSVSGSFSDSFDIPSNDSDESDVIMTTEGTGVPVSVPLIQVTDSVSPANDLHIPFGSITDGLYSNSEYITISNTGTASLDLTSIKLSGRNTNAFVLDFNGGENPCGNTISSINAGVSCTVQVTFVPIKNGPQLANIVINSSDPDDAYVNVALSGRGVSSDSNNSPSTPELIYPKNKQQNMGKTIKFRWKKSKDSDNDSVSYALYVCEDENFTTGCVNDLDITASNDNKSIYYAGIHSDWMVIFIFGFFILIFSGSSNNRRKLILLLMTIIITIFILISCSSYEKSDIGSINGSTSNEVSRTVSNLDNSSTYYWKVQASDGKGGTTDSETWSFDTN